MITESQARTRLRGIYSLMVKRCQEKTWKSGRRAGRVRVAAKELPFSREEFIDWAIQQVGYGQICCPYCGMAIDILDCGFDHITPISRGGSLGLENQLTCCKPCNALKGRLNFYEFRALMDGLRSFPEAARNDVLGRLRTGAMGLRLRNFPNPNAKLKQAPIVDDLTLKFTGSIL